MTGVRVDELMGVSDRSRGAPAGEERPGRYVGCFENKFGELLVFVHDAGERDAAVFLGDVGWVPRRVRDAGGRPDVGDLILNDEERAVDRCALDRDDVTARELAVRWRRRG